MASFHPLSRREVLLGTFGAAIATMVSGQNRSVRILLSVRDKNGKYVTNLEKADFEVRERGKAQVIQTLAPAERALHLGVLVDMGFGMQSALSQARDAAAAFFLDALRADKDLGSLILFDRDVRMVQAPTQSLADLQKAIETMQPPSPPMGRGPGAGGPGVGKGGGQQRPPAGGSTSQPRMPAMGSVVFDAIDFAAEEENATSSDRKAIVLLSEGADAGSIETLDGAVEAARKRNLLVYTVRIQPPEGSGGGFQIGMPGGMGGGGMGGPGGGGGMGGPGGGMGGPGGGMGGGGRGGGGGMGGPGGGGGMGGPGGGMPQRPDGKKPLQKLAESTGGRYFEFSKKQSLGQIFAEIRDELRHQYVLEFTPAQQAAAAGFQPIDVRSKRRGTKLQMQPGYYFEP